MKEPFEGFEGKRRPIPYDHYGTGLELAPREAERMIEADPITYAKEPRFKEPYVLEGDRMGKTLDEIRETVDLLKAHGIRLIVFINPIHKTTYLATGLETFFLFEKELSRITELLRFQRFELHHHQQLLLLRNLALQAERRHVDACPHIQRQ